MLVLCMLGMQEASGLVVWQGSCAAERELYHNTASTMDKINAPGSPATDRNLFTKLLGAGWAAAAPQHKTCTRAPVPAKWL